MGIDIKKMDMPMRWLLISTVHALAAMLLSMYIFSLPFKMGLLVAVAVYLGMWYVYPQRFYRRAFLTILGLWSGFAIASALKLQFESTLFDGLTKFVVELQSHWISHVCWTIIMLALLGLDYLGRKPQLEAAENDRRTRGIGGVTPLSLNPPKLSLILFLIFIVVVLIIGPGI